MQRHQLRAKDFTSSIGNVPSMERDGSARYTCRVSIRGQATLTVEIRKCLRGAGWHCERVQHEAGRR